MIVIRRILLFLFFFTIDVRVKAAEVIDKGFVQSPVGCYQKASPCSLKVTSESAITVQHNNHSLILSPKTSVTLERASVTLLKGIILIEEPADLVVKTVNGVIKTEHSTVMFSMNDQLAINTITGVSHFEDRSGKINLSLLPGMSLTVGRVTESGTSEISIPSPSLFEPSIRTWGNLTQLSKTEFKKRALKYKKNIVFVADRLAVQFENLSKRRIASEKQRLENLKAWRRNRAKENARLRELFRKKLYN